MADSDPNAEDQSQSKSIVPADLSSSAEVDLIGYPTVADSVMAAMAAVADFIQGAFTKEDYTKLPGNGPYILNLTGYHKLALFMNVRPEFSDAGSASIDDPRIFAFRQTCKLVSRDTGRILAEAQGLCSSEEKSFKRRLKADDSPVDLANSVLKMAQVRAFRAAIRQAAALPTSVTSPRQLPPNLGVPSRAADDSAPPPARLEQPELLWKPGDVTALFAAWRSVGYAPKDILDLLGVASLADLESRAKADQLLIEKTGKNPYEQTKP